MKKGDKNRRCFFEGKKSAEAEKGTSKFGRRRPGPRINRFRREKARIGAWPICAIKIKRAQRLTGEEPGARKYSLRIGESLRSLDYGESFNSRVLLDFRLLLSEVITVRRGVVGCMYLLLYMFGCRRGWRDLSTPTLWKWVEAGNHSTTHSFAQKGDHGM
jgi:hypothetical protein